MGLDDYLPHLTLAMGTVKEEDLPTIQKDLRQILLGSIPIEIRISHMAVKERPDGLYSCTLVVEPSEKLQALHEGILDTMARYFTYEADPQMFYSPPRVEKIPLYWLQNYHKTSVRKDYYPHITVGVGKHEITEVAFRFKSERIIIGHLGNFCTIRKVISEIYGTRD